MCVVLLSVVQTKTESLVFKHMWLISFVPIHLSFGSIVSAQQRSTSALCPLPSAHPPSSSPVPDGP